MVILYEQWGWTWWCPWVSSNCNHLYTKHKIQILEMNWKFSKVKFLISLNVIFSFWISKLKKPNRRIFYLTHISVSQEMSVNYIQSYMPACMPPQICIYCICMNTVLMFSKFVLKDVLFILAFQKICVIHVFLFGRLTCLNRTFYWHYF